MSEKVVNEELRRRLAQCPPKGSVWRHYKSGSPYVVQGSAIREATQEPLVLYQRADAERPIQFARPLAEWGYHVMHEGKWVPRFVQVKGPSRRGDPLRGMRADEIAYLHGEGPKPADWEDD